MSYTTATHDGFTVETNTGDEAAVMASLGGEVVPAVEGAEPVAEPTEGEPEKPAVEATEEKPTDRNPDGTFKAKPKKGSLDRLIWEREEAERKYKAADERAAKVEAELAELRKPKAAPVPERVEKTETPAKFTFAGYDEWLTTHEGASYEEYIEERAVAKLEHTLDAKSRERAKQEETESLSKAASAHVAREVVARQSLADYDERVKAGTAAMAAAGFGQLPEALSRAILTSDRSAEIVYDLASHPEVAIQLAQDAQGLAVGAAPVMRRYLESRLTAASSGPAVPPKVKTSAHPLIKPVSGTPGTTDPDEPDDDEPIESYIRRENARDRKTGRR